MPKEHDLFSLLPDTLRKDRRAYNPGNGMYAWDTAVCWYLMGQGYESKSFHTVDGDSFGPLVRGVMLRKSGETEWKLWTYG